MCGLGGTWGDCYWEIKLGDVGRICKFWDVSGVGKALNLSGNFANNAVIIHKSIILGCILLEVLPKRQLTYRGCWDQRVERVLVRFLSSWPYLFFCYCMNLLRYSYKTLPIIVCNCKLLTNSLIFSIQTASLKISSIDDLKLHGQNIFDVHLMFVGDLKLPEGWNILEISCTVKTLKHLLFIILEKIENILVLFNLGKTPIW